MLTFLACSINGRVVQIASSYAVNSVSAEFLCTCLKETIAMLRRCTFDVILTVCDNHPANRKLFRLLTSKT